MRARSLNGRTITRASARAIANCERASERAQFLLGFSERTTMVGTRRRRKAACEFGGDGGVRVGGGKSLTDTGCRLQSRALLIAEASASQQRKRRRRLSRPLPDVSPRTRWSQWRATAAAEVCARPSLAANRNQFVNIAIQSACNQSVGFSHPTIHSILSRFGRINLSRVSSKFIV